MILTLLSLNLRLTSFDKFQVSPLLDHWPFAASGELHFSLIQANFSLSHFTFSKALVSQVGSSITIFVCIEKIDTIMIQDFFVDVRDDILALKVFAFQTVILFTSL